LSQGSFLRKSLNFPDETQNGEAFLSVEYALGDLSNLCGSAAECGGLGFHAASLVPDAG